MKRPNHSRQSLEASSATLADSNTVPVVEMSWRAFHFIYETVGKKAAESGGVLGRGDGSATITHYEYDVSSQNSAVTYTPDHERLNELFEYEWGPQDVRLAGFVHSHPVGLCRPSLGDMMYASQILKGIPDLGELFLPIVQSEPDAGRFTLTPWIASLTTGNQPVRAAILLSTATDDDLSVASTSTRRAIDAALPMETASMRPSIAKRRTAAARRRSASGATTPDAAPTREDLFVRVKDAYDLPRMASSQLVVVGTGGSAEWVESMARVGVGHFVLIDHDEVDTPNIATQQTYLRDVGKRKVEAIRSRIREINPEARVTTIAEPLDSLNDEAIQRLCAAPGVEQNLLCGFTDQFEGAGPHQSAGTETRYTNVERAGVSRRPRGRADVHLPRRNARMPTMRARHALSRH